FIAFRRDFHNSSLNRSLGQGPLDLCRAHLGIKEREVFEGDSQWRSRGAYLRLMPKFTASSSSPSNKARSAPISFAPPATWALKDSSRSAGIGLVSRGAQSIE